jgi:hypothetical protein
MEIISALAVKRRVLVVLLPLAFASHVSAQTGFIISKSCPSSVAPGSTFTCTFSVQSRSSTSSVINFSVTNTWGCPPSPPIPGCPSGTGPVPCTQNGNQVTSLGPGGTCTGTVTETAGACQSAVGDQLCASGTDSVGHFPVSECTTALVQIPPCTPGPTATNIPSPTSTTATPTITPIPTGTTMPTNTPTGTPTPTITPTPGPGIAVSMSCGLTCYPCAVLIFVGIPSYTFGCNFSVTNLDPKHDVVIQSVTVRKLASSPSNDSWRSGTPLGPIEGCLIPADISPGSSCFGFMGTTMPPYLEGAPSCYHLNNDLILNAEIDVQGFVGVQKVSGSATASAVLFPCGLEPFFGRPTRQIPFREAPPTPAGKAVTPSPAALGQAPTNTPTNAQTLTNRSVQQQAAVPTLSFPMLGLFATAVLGAALWVLRGR